MKHIKYSSFTKLIKITKVESIDKLYFEYTLKDDPYSCVLCEHDKLVRMCVTAGYIRPSPDKDIEGVYGVSDDVFAEFIESLDKKGFLEDLCSEYLYNLIVEPDPQVKDFPIWEYRP